MLFILPYLMIIVKVAISITNYPEMWTAAVWGQGMDRCLLVEKKKSIQTPDNDSFLRITKYKMIAGIEKV